MTDQEKRQQKAMLLLEFREAEEEFSHLAEKARRWTDGLRIVIGVLDNAREEVFSKHRDEPKSRELTEHQNSFLNTEAVEQLIGELNAMRAKLLDLQKRKAALGLS